MKYLFLCYPGCTTCKKAKAWLDSSKVAYQERNIKEEEPSEAELTAWLQKSSYPSKRFFNTSGRLYRELGLEDKLKNMSEAEQIVAGH